jgi:D-3-phosphoglycerate dehydrogenase
MSMKSGMWERSKFMGTELAGKTLAVVGCGRIGQQVAKWGQAFDMNVIGFDPVLPAASFKELGIKKCDLDKIWPQADFITLHTPLTPDTKNLISAATLAEMKKGVHIVNCARGGIVNEMDLLAALESGHVGGAALDVYEKEPPGENTKKLLAHPNVSCTPHLGASTEEAQINVAKDIAVQMCDTLDSKDFVGVCNVGYMSIAQNKAIRPFSELSQQLGRVATQFALGKVTKLSIATWGQADISITSRDARALLKAQALVGFLSTVDTKGVHPGIVNAPFLAEEVGVGAEVSEEAPSMASIASPYRNLINVTATAEDGSVTSVTGSVFGNEPCLVSLDNYKNFPALNLHEGSVLKFRNKDQPGAVSDVSICAD